MGGGIQLLSSTDSTYCPDGELLFNNLSCGVSLTDRCVKFNDFFQLNNANSSLFKWNPYKAIQDGYHNNKTKLITRNYFDGQIPQGQLLYTNFSTIKTFLTTNINRLSSGSNAIAASGMSGITTSDGRASISGNAQTYLTLISNIGTVYGIIIVIKNIRLGNSTANANKNIIQLYSASDSSSMTGTDRGIQIGFQPNNSFYFRNYMNSPWRSYYSSEVPVIGTTTLFSAAFLFTGTRLVSMFYANKAITPSTILLNDNLTYTNGIVGANPSMYGLILGSKMDSSQYFIGSIGDIQIGFIHSWK